MDRLGAQARQAARAESIAARRDRHDLPGRRRPPARRARRRPLRDHPRRRHATAAGRRQAAGREDGAPAQPPAARSPHRPRGRGLRGAAAARHAVAADRPRGIALPARLLGSGRHRPVRVRRLRRLPGSLRRRLLHAARESTTSTPSKPRSPGASPRTRSSVTTCWRASSRAPGWSPTSRSSRSSRRATTSPRRASIAGRAAIGSCFPGSSAAGGTRAATRPARAIPVDRPLEDARQPAPHAVGAGRLPRPAGGMDAAARRRRGLDRVRPRDDRAARACCPFVAGIVPRRLGISKRSHLRAVGADLALASVADRVPGHAARASGVVDDRRHRAHALPSVRAAPAHARVGHRRAGEVQPAARCPRVLPADGRRRRARRGGRGRRRLRRARRLADRGSIRDPVDAVAGRRAVGEPSAAAGGPQAGLRRGRAGTAADRPPHLALLRDLRHGGGSHASSRQLSGRPEAGGGASDVAHEPRAVSAVRRRRPRFRLAGYARDRRAAGGDARRR